MPLTTEPFGGEEWDVRYIEHALEDGDYVDPDSIIDLLKALRRLSGTEHYVQPSWEPGMDEEYRDIHTVECEMCHERREQESEDD
jgi:hypothetical protein